MPPSPIQPRETPQESASTSWREFAAANERRIIRLEERLSDHLHEYEEFRRTVTDMTREQRELEDWQVEVGVYLRQLRWVVVLCFVIAALSALQDIALDAYRRELLADNELGLGNSSHVNAYRISGLVPGSLSLILADHLPWDMVFIITGFFMFIGIGLTLSITSVQAVEGAGLAVLGKFARALIRNEANAYKTQGLQDEALALFRRALATSTDLPAEVKASIEFEIRQIEEELSGAALEESQQLSEEQIAVIRQGWSENATVDELVVCAHSLHALGRHGEALLEFRKSIQKGYSPHRIIGPISDCLVRLHEPRQVLDGVRGLTVEMVQGMPTS